MTILRVGIDADETIVAAAEALDSGRLVALPTETVYGIAADAGNGEAVAQVFEAKGRPRFNPLIVHADGFAMAEAHGVLDERARRLGEAFWPGPLTLVVRRRADSRVHPLTAAGLPTIALRVPRGIAGAIIAHLGRPLAVPSANRSGRISPTRAEHAVAELGDRLALVIDAGPCTIGVESTIVALNADMPRLLRPGGVMREDIEAVLGEPLTLADKDASVAAPGMLRSHYAPRAAVRLDAVEVGVGEALLAFGSADLPGRPGALAVRNLSPSGDLREAAANLFGFLTDLDALQPTAIAVMPVPRHGLGEAIVDRLERAAAPRD